MKMLRNNKNEAVETLLMDHLESVVIVNSYRPAFRASGVLAVVNAYECVKRFIVTDEKIQFAFQADDIEKIYIKPEGLSIHFCL